MTKVEKIQAEIEALSKEDFVRLREWFAERDWLLWDKQLEADIADGKLDVSSQPSAIVKKNSN
ncbi:hypothetical protein [Moorena producens]|uniref:hypothetical protein n=1 Tax=Moorena producens TaxID=1155739 RepID=UPI003C77DB28